MALKKLACPALIVLFTITLSACTKSSPEPAEGMNDPRDEVAGTLFAASDEVGWTLRRAGSIQTPNVSITLTFIHGR